MPYTTEDGGRLNNFANEPKVYQAEPLSPTEKRNNLVLGFFASLLVAGIIAIAFMATNMAS